jgi:hypothetical protein
MIVFLLNLCFADTFGGLDMNKKDEEKAEREKYTLRLRYCFFSS